MIYRDSKGRFCKAPIKGYKGFEQGLICRGKQYKVGKVFTEPEAIPCISGIHFCKNPLDVLKFYSPVSNIGIPNEYAEVEALEEPVTDDNIKFCTTKLKIVRKLSLDELIEEFRKVSKCAICDDYDFNVEYTKFSNNDEFLVIGTINQNFGRISAGFVGF